MLPRAQQLANQSKLNEVLPSHEQALLLAGIKEAQEKAKETLEAPKQTSEAPK